ncbi:hypothetical protein ACFIOY_32435 [Bradyrhizobium sp. TZ2]
MLAAARFAPASNEGRLVAIFIPVKKLRMKTLKMLTVHTVDNGKPATEFVK